MSKNVYAVFGASGFGREVMPVLRGQIEGAQLFFVDDNPVRNEVNGHRVISYQEFLGLDVENKFTTIAIADSTIRKQLTERCMVDGVNIVDVVAGNSVVSDEVDIGPGAILCPFTMITSNVKVGIGFHANIYSYIAHDCVVGDYVTFAPGVKCNGNIVIGDFAYIGTGAIIKQGRSGKPLRIGKGAVVGMGAVVTKDVADGVVVVGNPAKPLARKGLGS